MRRPGERSPHQVSTAHFQAAYPAVAEPGLGARGVYIGRDIHGGSFVYDPWVLYAAGVLNDANMLVIGRPGHGKSALVKSWMYRSRVFGRTCELIDPKGEYAPLTKALGGQVLTFTPGGTTRLNPLTRLGSREMREGLLEAIARAMLDRPLTQPEALGLAAALAAADRHADGADVCIPDVTTQLRDPGQDVADQLACTRQAAQAELRECALALQRLTHGPLRGMFDQPTQASEQVWDAPAVCLDLSQVGVGQAQSNLAVAIVMVCASAFLDAKRRERAQQARAERPRTRQDDKGQRRVLARPADPRARRVLPVRVQAQPRQRRAAHPRAAPPLRPARRRRRRLPPTTPRPRTPRRSLNNRRLPPTRPRGPRHSRRARPLNHRPRPHRTPPPGRRPLGRRRPLLRSQTPPLRPRMATHRHRQRDGNPTSARHPQWTDTGAELAGETAR